MTLTIILCPFLLSLTSHSQLQTLSVPCGACQCKRPHSRSFLLLWRGVLRPAAWLHISMPRCRLTGVTSHSAPSRLNGTCRLCASCLSRESHLAAPTICVPSVSSTPSARFWMGWRLDMRRRSAQISYETALVFAYLPHRAAEDCLLLAGEHCRRVKALAAHPGNGPRSRHSTLQGGLQICVDLSQAFDRVQRGLVERSIRASGFTREVEAALIGYREAVSAFSIRGIARWFHAPRE